MAIPTRKPAPTKRTTPQGAGRAQPRIRNTRFRKFLDPFGAKRDRFMASLTSESEFFGFVGRGYANSFYKVYVRPKAISRRWWRFELDSLPSGINPIRENERLPLSARVEKVHGRLKDLTMFSFMPERIAIQKLFDRAAALSQQDPA